MHHFDKAVKKAKFNLSVVNVEKRINDKRTVISYNEFAEECHRAGLYELPLKFWSHGYVTISGISYTFAH